MVGGAWPLAPWPRAGAGRSQRARAKQINLTHALGISIYPLEFRTVRKSDGRPSMPGTVRESPGLLARVGVSSASVACSGFGQTLRWLEPGVVELNTRGRYAVMAMADLAKHGADGSLPLPAIAERQQISLAYLE